MILYIPGGNPNSGVWWHSGSFFTLIYKKFRTTIVELIKYHIYWINIYFQFMELTFMCSRCWPAINRSLAFPSALEPPRHAFLC